MRVLACKPRYLHPPRSHTRKAPGRPAATHVPLTGIVALDVEYIHLKWPGKPAETSHAGWVAMVGDDGKVLLDVIVALEQQQQLQQASAASTKQDPCQPAWVGGVPLWQVMQQGVPLTDVAAEVRCVAQGRLLIGHGLHKVRALDTHVQPPKCLFIRLACCPNISVACAWHCNRTGHSDAAYASVDYRI